MNTTAKTSIREMLKEHQNFGECVLEAVDWQNFGTTLDLVFNYIWTEGGQIRRDLDRRDLRVLRLVMVQEFHLSNALSEWVCAHAEELDWGISEVAAVRLEDDSLFLARYRSFSTPFHHLSCRWEGDRRIDVVFSKLELVRGEYHKTSSAAP